MTTHIVLTTVVCWAASACAPAEVRIWDGDTAWFAGRKVRMVDYDAPEFASKSRCRREEGLAARSRLAAGATLPGIPDRAAADAEFRRALRACGVSRPLALAMWVGVRVAAIGRGTPGPSQSLWRQDAGGNRHGP